MYNINNIHSGAIEDVQTIKSNKCEENSILIINKCTDNNQRFVIVESPSEILS